MSPYFYFPESGADLFFPMIQIPKISFERKLVQWLKVWPGLWKPAFAFVLCSTAGDPYDVGLLI